MGYRQCDRPASALRPSRVRARGRHAVPTAQGALAPSRTSSMQPGPPPAQGLYDPTNEHDSCAVGFIVDLKARKSHQIVKDGITALINMSHRGACGCENNTGDGAGLLIQIPHTFLVSRCRAMGITLPEPGAYGVGAFFSSRDQAHGRRG